MAEAPLSEKLSSPGMKTGVILPALGFNPAEPGRDMRVQTCTHMWHLGPLQCCSLLQRI